jgi:archaellum component FlaC
MTKADNTQTVVSDSGKVTQITFEDDLHKLAHEQLVGFITQRNALVSQANAAHGNREELAHSITETSDDPEIVAAREARDEAIMTLHKLVTPKVEDMLSNAEQNTADLDEKVKELDKKIKPGLTYYKQMYSEDAVNALPSQVRSKQGSMGGGGGGGRRIRGYEIVTLIDGEEQGHENTAGLAKYLDVETVTLQEQFFSAAGNPKALKDAPDVVEFDVAFKEVDEDGNESDNSAHVTFTRQAKDEAPEADES